MKLCIECKYLSNPLVANFGTPMCFHEKAPVSPVNGSKNGSCDLMRSSNCTIEQCGPDGDWFEAAPKPELKPYDSYCVRKVEEKPKKKFWRIFG